MSERKVSALHTLGHASRPTRKGDHCDVLAINLKKSKKLLYHVKLNICTLTLSGGVLLNCPPNMCGCFTVLLSSLLNTLATSS